MKKVILVASEADPFIKSGGLADVIGSLPKSLQQQGIEPIVIVPKYKDMNVTEPLQYITHFYTWVGWRNVYCGVWKAVSDNVTFYFIDNEQYFGRDGLYGYDDDYERFAFFDIAVMEIIGHLQLHPAILHLHDWQSAMIAMLYKEKYCQYPFYEDIKIIFTIHNIAYQGKADPAIIGDMFGMNNVIYENGNCRHDNCLNMMKTAIIYSDIITTVSPSYAKEILTPTYGEGLESVLQLRKDHLYGILNGIDEKVINPNKQTSITKNYTVQTVFEDKPINKEALQKECHLPQEATIPLIAIVSRLTSQKGIDLILEKIDAIVHVGTQVVVLGAGESHYEEAFQALMRKYPDHISFHQKYDFALAQRMYASCDIFLMPSLFEPCGLSQMMAMRYGTIPVVREVGGLRDSVEAYNKYTNEGNGFRFYQYHAEDMLYTLKEVISIYNDQQDIWKALVLRAMLTPLSWKQSAKEYILLYNK